MTNLIGAVIMAIFIAAMVFMAVAVIKEAIEDLNLNGFDWSDFAFYFLLAGAPIGMVTICITVCCYHLL